jgi:hypothetical protein
MPLSPFFYPLIPIKRLPRFVFAGLSRQTGEKTNPPPACLKNVRQATSQQDTNVFGAHEMNTLPRDRSPDSTLAMLMDGYEFIQKRRERYRSDAFLTRVMGEQAVCIGGAEAARIFYDNDRFRRRGAMPNRIRKSLTGEGAVHTLDGAVHQRRKEMFMALMTPEVDDAIPPIAIAATIAAGASAPQSVR